MELYDLASPVEARMAEKAGLLFHPLGGTMELTPLCNLDCKMCFIRQSPEEVRQQGSLLSQSDWLRIAGELRDCGVLFLLLTGGEPLLYPHFKSLYLRLNAMGFILTVNTNGTLIDEEWADFFAACPCRRLNLTIYGASGQTYRRLCGSASAFDRVITAARLLRERDIPFRFNCSLTPHNQAEVPQIYQLARDFDVPLETNTYMFPPVRRGTLGGEKPFVRLSPKEAADTMLESLRLKNPSAPLSLVAENVLNRLLIPNLEGDLTGLSCRAGRSGFWITWQGHLQPCGMINEPQISLLSTPFSAAWSSLVEETQKITGCSDCKTCKKRNLCRTCGASSYTETGSCAHRPDYQCQLTDQLISLLIQQVSPEKQRLFRQALS